MSLKLHSTEEHLTFNYQDLIINSPYYFPYSSLDVSLKDLVLDYLIIP